MERENNWRSIDARADPEADQPAAQAGPPADGGEGLHTPLLAVVGAIVVAGAAILLWAATPQPQLVLGPDEVAPGGLLDASPPSGGMQPSGEDSVELIVDVQGAVLRPGLQRLPEGARVGDAIAAAGGYGPQIDIRTAAERLNLAERVSDGTKIYVPVRGESTPPAAAPQAAAGGAPNAPPGLIEVNGASQVQLETLPGIGPVTAAKIIAAREEQPFASIDELLGRKVVGPATFEKIKPLITVSP